MTISAIIAALVGLINSWKKTDNLENDLADAVLALSTVSAVVPHSPLVAAALRVATGSEAGLANLANGQAATVAQLQEGDATYSLVLVKNGGTAAQSLGL